MDITTSSLTAAQGYANAKSAARPDPASASAESAFAQYASDFTATVQAGEETAKAAMSGGADPYALVQALTQSELAVETAVTVRDKVVEAYQEILRMPV